MRASALSDDRVIAAVNQHFVPVAINVTKDGFPVQHIPALQYAEKVYASNWRFEFGFASCIAIDDSGQIPMAFSGGTGHKKVMNQRMHGDLFLEMIDEALRRHKQIVNVRRSMFSLNFAAAGQQMAAIIADIRLSFQTKAMEAMRERSEMEAAPGQMADVVRAFNNN
eukprot:Unigene7839_Nuclearia_a/m.24067 Unigene7839_Nuclearia_a/g.24067  ORF Unigene7839_Nuclearia_a/g.24067 Unigene7839_Nuclearia_a/m.24067 type:complete len:167 (-) Unigene7839_Nuclearia_a:188-688(-)